MTRILAPWANGVEVLRVPASVVQAAEYQTREDTSELEESVKGTIEGNDRTLTLHRRVSHLELRRRLRDGTGGEDLWIRELRVETDGAAMDDSCGSGKAEDIKGPQPVGAHA
eukprot:scaffold9370_cov144-Isochrysis_galbana.AAC.1